MDAGLVKTNFNLELREAPDRPPDMNCSCDGASISSRKTPWALPLTMYMSAHFGSTFHYSVMWAHVISSSLFFLIFSQPTPDSKMCLLHDRTPPVTMLPTLMPWVSSPIVVPLLTSHLPVPPSIVSSPTARALVCTVRTHRAT